MPKIKTPTDVPPGLVDLQQCDSFSVTSAKRDDAESLVSEDEIVEQIERTKDVSFSVQGLYNKWYPTFEEDATNKREFACCRYRLWTRPLFEEESDEEDETSDSSINEDEQKDGNNSTSIIDKEDHSQSESESESDSEYDYETAMFVPKIGLIDGYFWHQYDDEAKVIREDRAVLFQSQENYERLLSHDRFKTCFEDIDYMEYPTFGEQVIVNGVEMSDMAIGDVFEIEGGHSPLVVEITAPRKPCSYMNFKHGTRNGKMGIQNFAHENILAGWFARVLVAGELREGMKFIRKAHPNPKWTLTYIHKALYGEGNRLQMLMNVSSWNRDREELEELIALPQLGEYEWKVEGRRRLLNFDGIDWKTVRHNLIDPQVKVPNFFLQFYLVAKIVETLTTALKHFGII